ETGEATVERFLLAYDIGRSINPMLVEGQLVGGFVQGLGGALCEEFRYDEHGQPLSATLADYALPTAREVPAVEVLVTEDAPTPRNPLGIKSVGEGGINGVGAVIAAAIDDAIGFTRRGDAAPGNAAAAQNAYKRGGAAQAVAAVDGEKGESVNRGRSSSAMGGPQPAPLLTLLKPSTVAAYTAAGFWSDQTIDHLAARQARAMPQAFALRDRDRRLSYPELVDAADRLAAHLAGHGIRPGNRVAVWLPSRVETA